MLGFLCAAVSATLLVSAGEPMTTEPMKQRGLVSTGDAARIQAVLAKARRCEPFSGTEKDKVQIGWGGAAGL
jgi:hypothetical protein